MDRDSLYLPLAEKELEDCIRPEMRAEWQRLRSNDCVDNFTADAVANFLPRTCCVKHKQHDRREPGLFKEEFRCTEIVCLCSKTYCCYDVTSNKLKVSSKGLNNCVLEQSHDRTLEKHRWALNGKIMSVRTIQDSEQTITLLPPMNKLRKVCPTFTQN